MLITETFSAPLSRLIVKEYNGLALAISKIKSRTKKDIEGTGGKVSAADLIAYQIGWGRLLIAWHETGERGETPQMPGEGFTKWDYTGLAKHFYQKYQYDSGKKQEAEFYQTVSTLLNIVEKEHRTGRLDQTGVWAWCTLPSGKEWPLSKWIKVNTSSPYNRAARLIRSNIFKE